MRNGEVERLTWHASRFDTKNAKLLTNQTKRGYYKTIIYIYRILVFALDYKSLVRARIVSTIRGSGLAFRSGFFYRGSGAGNIQNRVFSLARPRKLKMGLRQAEGRMKRLSESHFTKFWREFDLCGQEY